MRKFPLNLLNLCLVAALFAVGACSSKPKRDADSHYDISVATPAISYGSEATIMLRRVDIRGLQSGRTLIQIVANDPIKFEELRGHFWHVSTPTLIERAVTDALNASSQDAVFGNSNSMQDADYTYSVDIRQFAYEPAGSAKVAFNAVVRNKAGKIVLAGEYQATSPLGANGTNDVLSAVKALSTAFSSALSGLSADLANII